VPPFSQNVALHSFMSEKKSQPKIDNFDNCNIWIGNPSLLYSPPKSHALPVHPAWHPQEKDPNVLWQSPLQHTDGEVRHSSISGLIYSFF
jgi:hypothetical protein